MKIIQLTAENIKKLRAVEIRPDGVMVQVTGPNGSGKSSVLDSIWYALSGKDAIPGKPIRDGAEKARIRLDLGELIVERRFTANGTTLTVSNADGARYASPQSMLDKLLGVLTFDPLEFSRKPPQQQFEALRNIVKLPIDLDAMAAQDERDYAARTDLNRQQKMLRARIIEVPEFYPTEPIDEMTIVNRIEQASTNNVQIETLKADRERRKSYAADLERRAAELKKSADDIKRRAEERIEKLQAEIRRISIEADDTIERVEMESRDAIRTASSIQDALAAEPPISDPIDVASLRDELSVAKAKNSQYADRQKMDELRKMADELEAQSRALTASMEERESQRREALAAAKMPVSGLGLGNNCVTFGGIPLDQASDAERIAVSTAVAMALNPKLRVLRIKEGSLLDSKTMKVIASLAAESDYQVWVERVDESGKIGVVMEEGSVSAVNPAQQESLAL